MKNIPITTDHAEMRKIGEQLFKENAHVYDERMMGRIYEIIDEHMPNATKEEKEEVFFRSLYDYWVYGNNIAEEFYFDFANKTHEEKLSYMTFRMRFHHMHHLNTQEHRHFLDNKWHAYELLKDYYKRDALLLTNDDDFAAFCEFTDKHPSFVVKPVGLSAGSGVYKETVEGKDKKEVFDYILSQRQPLAKAHPIGDASQMMIEEIIVQHEAMAKLHPASVQSVRLVTVKVGDKVHIWHPRIDIGRGGSFLINGAQGGIMALIDPETGVIINKGMPESGESFEYHPDTGEKILGFQLPEWDKVIEMVTNIMLNILPGTCYVGWDMAYSTKGWCIVEGNWAGEFVGDQIGTGRGLRYEFEELIGWKPDVTFWWEE